MGCFSDSPSHLLAGFLCKYVDKMNFFLIFLVCAGTK